MSAESDETDSAGVNARAAEGHVVGPMALVGELWLQWPPVAVDTGEDGAGWRVTELRRSLAALVDEATRLASDGAPDDRDAARLLAETAQTVHDVLGTHVAPGDRATPPGVAPTEVDTSWKDRLRLARLERWLAVRAESDADAKAAASLCLWVLEHLEMAVPPSRRILPP